jgi:hypothetical protein
MVYILSRTTNFTVSLLQYLIDMKGEPFTEFFIFFVWLIKN